MITMEIGPGGMRVDSVKKESGYFELHALNAAPPQLLEQF